MKPFKLPLCFLRNEFGERRKMAQHDAAALYNCLMALPVRNSAQFSQQSGL